MDFSRRHFERARRLAEALGGHPRQLAELDSLLVQSDIIIASTGARHYVVDSRQMKKALRARKYRPIFFIDIAVPRNIDPALNDLENVYVYDIDDLTAQAEENLAGRRREADVAEEMVVAQAKRFLVDAARERVKPTLVAIRRKAEALKAEELARAVKRLKDGDEQSARALSGLADSIVNKLLHDVLTGLKRLAEGDNADEVVEMVRALYGLEQDQDP